VLVIEVTRVGEESRLATIRRLVERAQSERPAIAAEADRLAGNFVATVLLLAAVTIGVWGWLDPSQIVPTVVAVLIVACPCALALATPAAVTAATDALMRRGVLIARGHVLESAAQLSDLVFDKTGTLTSGQMALRTVWRVASGWDEERILATAAALEAGSSHPLARAVTAAWAARGEGNKERGRGEKKGEEVVRVEGLTHTVGGGVWGWIEGKRVAIGRPEWVATELGVAAPPLPTEWEAEMGATVVALAREGEWVAWLAFVDQLRPEAKEVLAQLAAAGVRLHLFSGDRAESVAAAARGLPLFQAVGGLTPEEKHERLMGLRGEGRVVGMVGDGVNDAPVLAAAHVGVAMGAGADLARSRADVILLTDDLRGLVLLVKHARRTLAVIRQNLRWSFGYNVAAIPLAMAGWVTPWLAGIGMAASSLLVVINALRLQRVPRWI
ncbi:MAG: heavy metal translocating P-type ATPase, partial [Hydrogenophilus sp.]|nr:heavy metal translocating P-type ATPase [Hydrogenophilus sp.]